MDTLLPQVFGPGGGRRGKAQGYSNSIQQAQKDGDTQLAYAYVDSLINFTLKNYYSGNLIGGQSQDTQDRVVQFFYALYCANGISPIPDLSGLFDNSNSVLIRNSTPSTVVNSSGNQAGVLVNQGDVPSEVDGQPFFGTFVSVRLTTVPLPTSLDWYGNGGYKSGAFEFSSDPEVVFTNPVLTGTCISYDNAIVTNPGDLRLAHQVQPGYSSGIPGNYTLTTAGGTVEIGARVATTPLGLTCPPLAFAAATPFGRMLQQFARLVLPEQLLAAVTGGSTGSQVVKFSPFAAVDTKLKLTSLGPTGTQYIPDGSSTTTASVSVTTKTRQGTPIDGIPVAFAPSASFAPPSASTNTSGTAASTWTLVAGSNSGTGTPSKDPLAFDPSAASFSASVVQLTPLSITTSSLPGGQQTVAYGPVSLAATGGAGAGTYSWALAPGSNALPGGLTLSSAGSLSGTPTVNGSFSFTVRVTSGPTWNWADQLLTLNILPPPVVITTSSPLPDATVGVAYTKVLGATGGSGSVSWSLMGSDTLPTGLTLSGGTISGTPASPGTVTFTVQAQSAGLTDSKQLSLTVKYPTALALTFSPGPSKSLCYAVNAPITPGVRVKVTDTNGNPIPGVPVGMVAVTNNGSKVNVVPPSVTSDASGYASFGGPTINKTGGYQLIVTTGSPWPTASASSVKFNISPSC